MHDRDIIIAIASYFAGATTTIIITIITQAINRNTDKLEYMNKIQIYVEKVFNKLLEMPIDQRNLYNHITSLRETINDYPIKNDKVKLKKSQIIIIDELDEERNKLLSVINNYCMCESEENLYKEADALQLIIKQKTIKKLESQKLITAEMTRWCDLKCETFIKQKRTMKHRLNRIKYVLKNIKS